MAETKLQQSLKIFEALSSEQRVEQWLALMTWQELTIRNRGAVSAYYDQAVLARNESKKRLEAVRTEVGLVSFPSSDPSFYQKINNSLKSADAQIKENYKFYQELYSLFNYYEQSTLAVLNLIYYDPSITINFYKQAPDYEILLQRFGLDYAGLQKVEERLQNLPDFRGDTLKDFALPLVRPLTLKAKLISDLAGQRKDQEAIMVAEELDREVRSVQEKIVKNRQDFWKSIDRTSLIKQFNELRSKDLETQSSLENSLIELNHRK